MKTIILILVIFLNACGFRGVYGDSSYKPADIKIDILQNKNFNIKIVEAKYLNLLHKELNVEKNFDNEDYKYFIEIYLNWYETGSLRKGSGSLSRKDVVLKVEYKIKTKDNEVIDSDEIKTIGSVDVSDSRFTNYSLEKFVIDNLISSSVIDLKNKIASNVVF